MTKREIEAKLNELSDRIDRNHDYALSRFPLNERPVTSLTIGLQMIFDYLGVEVKHDEAKTYLVKKGKDAKK